MIYGTTHRLSKKRYPPQNKVFCFLKFLILSRTVFAENILYKYTEYEMHRALSLPLNASVGNVTIICV